MQVVTLERLGLSLLAPLPPLSSRPSCRSSEVVSLGETPDSRRQSPSLTCPRRNAPRRELIYFRRLPGRTGRQRDRRRDAVPRRAGVSWELSDEIERGSRKPPTSDPPPHPQPNTTPSPLPHPHHHRSHAAVQIWLCAFADIGGRAEIRLRFIFRDLRRRSHSLHSGPRR